MIIKVLGTGCKKCKELENNVRKAVEEIGVVAHVEKVEEIRDILSFGVMGTPALVINKKVISTGKVVSVEEIKKLLLSFF